MPRGRIRQRGRDGPRRLNREAGGGVVVVLAEKRPSRRGGTRSRRRWNWSSCSHPSASSRSLSGLATWNLGVGGER
jgi:hypothetical protein